MAKQKELQKIMIVFEETGIDVVDSNGAGKGFNVYLSGHKRNLNHVNKDDLSPAEFWALHMFSFVADQLKKSGAFRQEIPRPDGGVGH